MDPEQLKRYLPNRVIKQRVRNAAVGRVKKDLILHGKKEADLTEEELEYLVAEAESAVWGDIKQTGVIGALALLGLGAF